MKACNLYLAVLVSIFCIQNLAAKIVIYPAPKDEPLNTVYKLSANGQTIPVYNTKVGMGDNILRFKAVDDLLNSANYFDVAAFAYFDMSAPVTLTVSIDKPVIQVKILPESAAIKFTIHQNYINFQLTKPQNLTIEINGEVTKSLHIFADPIDTNIPEKQDPDVLFFGPGVHYLPATVIKSHQTLYIAGGAIVKMVIGKDEKYGTERSGLKNYAPRISLVGNDIKICGHGIIDAGDCPVHAGNFILINGNHIAISGVIIRNSCGWTVPIRRSNSILADNVKILGYRANSDGIDICNSSNVVVRNCFIRTGDDLIVIKTEKGEGEANHICIKNCVLWNEIAHPLSIGDETNEYINDVQFTGCEIIHDKGRECSFSISCADSALVENVAFKDIKIDEGNLFVSLWIGKDAASATSKYGTIKNVAFENITAAHITPQINMNGVDVIHSISGVLFNNISLNNQPLNKKNINSSSFVSNLVITP